MLKRERRRWRDGVEMFRGRGRAGRACECPAGVEEEEGVR